MAEMHTSSEAPKRQKRQKPGTACEECRRRKLRCDRAQPQCGLCRASGLTCQVPVARPPRGPKRGYLKTIRARLSALEGMILEQQQPRSGMLSPALISDENITMMDQLYFPWSFPFPGEDDVPSPVFEHNSSTASSLDGGSIRTTMATGTPPGLEIASYKGVTSFNQAQASAVLLVGSTPQETGELPISSLIQADLYVQRSLLLREYIYIMQEYNRHHCSFKKLV
ncbi:putative transcriptional regulatory protein [Tolypocladium ophioglossoides CBS 100239]|uniref:Putative transcriptional regulatory protein n=1 Tax=Tolypocladium ophioglossoides (strain CBS 100239) TaxID=1163406 RepID=A0A0L0NHZ0_TOLOC|nr:putative transcriptional regulatory protein [Tolypocladium ophioglossoides CBS 100239]